MLATLADILERSVERNGEVALTNKHMLNIVRMAIRRRDEEADRFDLEECRAEVEACGDR